jgi:hypothetical protein
VALPTWRLASELPDSIGFHPGPAAAIRIARLFESTSFRVKRKIFATAPADGEHLHIFVAHEDRELAIVMAPGVVEKLWWGGKVRGLRVALHGAKRPLVAELLKKAWLRKAPKALAATVRRGSERR